MRTVSVATMIEQLTGLCDTDDLTDWEDRFVKNMADLSKFLGTTKLSERQVETIERLWREHFA